MHSLHEIKSDICGLEFVINKKVIALITKYESNGTNIYPLMRNI